jgi:hypothetical protein
VAARRRRRQSTEGPGAAVFVGIAAAVLLLGGGLFWFLSNRGDEAPRPDVTLPAERPAPPEMTRDVEPLDLPELSASDAFVRDLVARLSEHPRLAAWLATDELIHRFVRVVLDLAGGSNPAANVRHMAPTDPFTVQQADGRLVIAPASYRRYDLLAATFASLDTEGTVLLYHQLRPLIDEAWDELGAPESTFHEVLETAIRNLLEADVPDRPLEVRQDEAVYVYVDPELEARRGAEKALMRMGPENARIIQSKLAEFAVALRIQR